MSSDTRASYAIHRIRSDNDDNRKYYQIKPERNLLAAVLSRAICDAYGSTAVDRQTFKSAKKWLEGPIEKTKPFSFGWVASQLDLDPHSLRQVLFTYQLDPEKMQECLNFLK